MKQNKYLVIGGAFIFLAVALGAFGAHGLKNILDVKALATFKTGVTYQMYNGIGILLVSLIAKVFQVDFSRSLNFMIIGIVLFSFNCYLYALTQIKTIAMIIPFGGMCFLIAWFLFSFKAYKELNQKEREL